MDWHGDDIYRLSPGIVVLWMLDMPSGPTVVLMLSAVGVSALFRRQNEEHDTAGQALPEFESPTPPKKGGQKTEQVIYTNLSGPPIQDLQTRPGGLHCAHEPRTTRGSLLWAPA